MCTPRSAFFRLTARSLGPTSRVLSERLTGKPEVNFPIADPPPTDCKFRKRPLAVMRRVLSKDQNLCQA